MPIIGVVLSLRKTPQFRLGHLLPHCDRAPYCTARYPTTTKASHLILSVVRKLMRNNVGIVVGRVVGCDVVGAGVSVNGHGGARQLIPSQELQIDRLRINTASPRLRARQLQAN
jgi:hypothetical protein